MKGMRIEMHVVVNDDDGREKKVGLASMVAANAQSLHGNSTLMMGAIVRKLVADGLMEDPYQAVEAQEEDPNETLVLDANSPTARRALNDTKLINSIGRRKNTI